MAVFLVHFSTLKENGNYRNAHRSNFLYPEGRLSATEDVTTTKMMLSGFDGCFDKIVHGIQGCSSDALLSYQTLHGTMDKIDD